MEEGEARGGGRPRLVRDGGGADLISALPEDLLVQVLSRLGCARAAARASLLSRHWRGLWRRIPDLTFRDVAIGPLGSVLDSLARLHHVFLLDIRVPKVDPLFAPLHEHHAARVSSLLHSAAELSPVDLRFYVPTCSLPLFLLATGGCLLTSKPLPVNLPSFRRATSIELQGLELLFTQPPASGHMFPVLETLCLSNCHVDVHAFVLHCPRLRLFTAADCLLRDQELTVHSASLQELVVESRGKWTSRIHLEVPALNRLVLSVFVGEELSVSVSAPVAEKVSWRCMYANGADAGIGPWGIETVRLESGSNVLGLHMGDWTGESSIPYTELSLEQEIEKHLVVTDISVLDLRFRRFTRIGHAFRAFLFHLLSIHWIRGAIKCLKIDLQNYQGVENASPCPENCPCDEPMKWRSQTISLINLQEVEIKGFQGEYHGFDMLGLILKYAPMLKRMTVKLSDNKVKTSHRWRKKIYQIFKAYPLVQCSVDSS